MQKTGIEYLTHTWNPIAMRCTPVSPGCENCWHLKAADRLSMNKCLPESHRLALAGKGPFILREKELTKPLHYTKPAIIGAQFMGDLFHPGVSDEMRWEIFGMMALASQQHTFVVLTKREKELLKFFKNKWVFAMIEGSAQKILHDLTGEDPSMWLAVHDLPNVWFGLTVCNQAEADEKISNFIQIKDLIPSAHLWLSIEPMLGLIKLYTFTGTYVDDERENKRLFRRYIDYMGGVVLGPETGPRARPMHPDWPRRVRDDCKGAGVPFFFKQCGEWISGTFAEIKGRPAKAIDYYGREIPPNERFDSVLGDRLMIRVPQRNTNRLLDGREWNDLPWIQKEN